MSENLFAESINCVAGTPFQVSLTQADGYKYPKGKFPDKITFNPIRVGTMMTIQPLLLKLDISMLTDDEQVKAEMFNADIKISESQTKCVNDNLEIILEIICLAYWNRPGQYPAWHKDFFKWNLETAVDLFLIVRGLISRINSMPFISSIIATKKAMSLVKNEELIASSIQCE